MNIYNQTILIIVFSMIILTETAFHNSIGKNYIRNIENSILITCNKKALNKTCNYDVYNCIINKYNNSCSKLENYTTFINIKNECIKEIHSECGISLFIILITWTLIGIIAK